jgi:uncharacterized membrane protein YjgN (DUF898 family)
MNLHETAPPAATAAPARVRFVGREGDYRRLMIRGALLLICTLGIYRFWLATDMRRFLWSNTEVAGDHLEYTGTALELLAGFLLAIAILLPVNILTFAAALDLGLIGRLSGVIAFVLLGLLTQFAIYRARRYRLSRTVYRGLRFYQTGSAWVFALYALMWWSLVLLTLGLAYPWAVTALERFKMRHSYYGDLRGQFAGSALSLFLRGLPLWLLVVAPLVAGMATAVQSVDWAALKEAVEAGGSGLADRIEATNPDYAGAIMLTLGATVWSMLAALALYPAFQALVLRWWSSGLRFGELAVVSRLRSSQVYRAWFRFLLHGLLFAAALSVLSLPFLAGVGLTEAQAGAEAAEVVALGFMALNYLVLALGYSTIYQVTVKLALWRLGMESIELSNVAVLENVKAGGRPTSALGEGLADALQVGGI